MSNYKFILLVFSVFILISGCRSVDSVSSDSDNSSQLVDPKYSIAKDRSEFDKLRQSIPEETRRENDEKALLAELTAELKHPPEVVREKLFNVLRKKREVLNKDLTKMREEFNKNERKTREAFLKELEEERKEFSNRKVDRDKRSEFFNEQDQVRREFMAEQREKRDDFEADIKEKRKNFEDYAKEKTDEFNAELKEYGLRWKEKLQKEKEESP